MHCQAKYCLKFLLTIEEISIHIGESPLALEYLTYSICQRMKTLYWNIIKHLIEFSELIDFLFCSVCIISKQMSF